MLAALLLDHRLAFFLLAALHLGTAVPLAFGWVRLLPEEAPPFQIDRTPTRRWSIHAHSNEEEEDSRRDPLAMVLLICVTASYAVQLPGLPRSLAFGSIPTVIPQDASEWARFALTWFLVVIPSFAAAYSLLRANFLRVPLIAAGILILLVWLLSAPLRAALEAVS
jgi:hypothetical protein